MPRGVAVVAVLAASATVATATPVHASEPSKKALKKAKRYEKKGKKLYKKKKYQDAIVAFDLAHKTAALPRHLFNIGKCHEQMGDLYTAWEFIQRYVDETEDPDEKEDAQEVADILRSKLQRTSGELLVEAKPEGAMVKVTGAREVISKAPMNVWLEAGTWELEVAKDGYEPQTSKVVIATGETVKRSLTLESTAARELREAEEEERLADEAEAKNEKAEEEARKKAEEEAQAAAATEEARKQAEADAGMPGMPALAAMGAGAALLVGGGLFGLLAKSANDDLSAMKSEPHPPTKIQDQHDTATSRENLAIALSGGGVVAVAVGVTLWMLQDGGEPTSGGLRWSF